MLTSILYSKINIKLKITQIRSGQILSSILEENKCYFYKDISSLRLWIYLRRILIDKVI